MHHWQDTVIAAGSFVLALSLLPSVLSRHKPSVWTSVVTGAVLISFTVAYASLKLWYSTFMTLLTALLWLVLAVQRWRQKS